MRPLFSRALNGVAAGVLATGSMSLIVLAGERLGMLGEPPPRRITRRLTAVLGPLRPRGRALDLAALGAHFGFGASMGLLFGLLPERAQTARGGGLFGLSVWVANYAGWLPKAGLMPEPSRDRAGRPTTMIAAHWVFGRTLSRVYRALRRPEQPHARTKRLARIHGQ